MITTIINCITCPFTVLLNVLVIMAVKRRPRLQSYTNILLACLAATDVLTGLAVQPSFILWKTFQLLGMTYDEMYTVRVCHNSLIRAVSVCSCLHLMLVNSERLIAIKFTMRYPYIVTKRNITVALIKVWVFTISYELVKPIPGEAKFLNLLVALVQTLFSCVLFVVSAYVILYRETLRHKKKIKSNSSHKKK